MYVFGDLLRQFRVRAGLTQLQLADELGVSRNAVNGWEGLKASPRLSREQIIGLRNILDLEEDDLNQLLLAQGFRLDQVDNTEQAKVVRYKAAEIDYLKVVRQLELAPGVLLPHMARRADCYQHISMPINYIERTGILEAVRSQVLSHTVPSVLTPAAKGKPVVLHGMGGIGKTVLARALCEDSAIQAAFPGGILWATLGQVPNLVGQVRLWIETLGGGISESSSSPERLKGQLAQLLNNRTCLLILDDVWKHTHVEAFRVDAPRCCFLLTTRDAEVARALGVQVHRIPVMEPDDAATLLEEWADGHLARIDPELKRQIVQRMGYLPLAIKLAGAQLQRKAPDGWLREFNVRKLKSSRSEEPHDSLEQTFLLSLDTLDTQAHQLYLAIAIFKKNEPIPQVAIERLWQGLAGLEAEAIADLLHDLAARALLEFTPQDALNTAHLHDLLHDLIGEVLGGNGRMAAHKALLQSYRAICQGDVWATAANDGYLYDHLAYHLQAAGAQDELKTLFDDQRWMGVRVQQRSYTYDGYLSDLLLVWDCALAETRLQIATNQEPRAFVDCIRYQLIFTSINSLASNYAPELVARAVETGLWSPRHAQRIALRTPHPYERIRILAALLNITAFTQEQRDGAERLGLECIEAMCDPMDAYFLAALAPLLPRVFRLAALERALETILALPWHEKSPNYSITRRGVLKALAPYLPDELLARALDTALVLPSEWEQHELLEILAPYLPKEQLARVLQIALTFPEPTNCATSG